MSDQRSSKEIVEQYALGDFLYDDIRDLQCVELVPTKLPGGEG